MCSIPHRQFRGAKKQDENCQRQIRCVFQYFQFSQWVFFSTRYHRSLNTKCDRAFFFFFIYRFHFTRAISLLIHRDAHTTLAFLPLSPSDIVIPSYDSMLFSKPIYQQQKGEGKIPCTKEENRGKTSAQHLPVSIHKMLMWCELVFDWFTIYGQNRRRINAKCSMYVLLLDLYNCRHLSPAKR